MSIPDTDKPKRRTRQATRSLQILGAMVFLGTGLTLWNVYSTRRDVAIAAGPRSDAQRNFFVAAADRPDIEDFFSKLTSPQRVAIARNLGRYSDPKLAHLVGRLLVSLDEKARSALTESLKKLAASEPNAVSLELKDPGSFQQLGVFESLRSIGPKAIPAVAARLTDADQRPTAIRFLVESGPPAIPALMSALQSGNADERLAAAEALSKLRAREAVPELTTLLAAATGSEREVFLAALSGIGDPRSEAILISTLNDKTATSSLRASSALGLGRIANGTSIRALWAHIDDPEDAVRETVLGGLRLAGSPALSVPDAHQDKLLLVAAGVAGDAADVVISSRLTSRADRTEAARACAGRPKVVNSLRRAVEAANAASDGKFIDSAIEALATTPSGQAVLQDWGTSSTLSGFVARRKALARQGPQGS